MSLLTSFSQSLVTVGRSLRMPGIYLLLLASVALWSLAYQHKSAYVVDVGGLLDDAYVLDFHSKERNPELNYRWSKGASTLVIPGIGNQPLSVSITTVGFRPQGGPPALILHSRGQVFPIQTQGQARTDTVFLERGDSWDGDLKLLISSPTFSPQGDARRLGVIVDRVVIEPAEYGIRPIVIPPVGALGALLLAVVASYLATVAATRRAGLGLTLAALLSAVFGALIVTARPELGLLVTGLVPLCGWTFVMVVAGRAALDAHVGSRAARPGFVIGASSAAFALAFVLRFGGLTYPQFLTSDLGLHVNNLLDVMRGHWLFTEPLPDGTPQPYPPALYALLSPVVQLMGSSRETLGLLLKWSVALLDSGVCLWIGWAGSRLWPGRAGGIAALAYAFSPAPFELFSAGNYTNLFAQSVLHITLLSALVFLSSGSRLKTAAWPVALSIGFGLTMLGHYGMMLAALFTMFLFGLWAVSARLMGRSDQRAWLLILACLTALAGSIALYYWHFAGEVLAQIGKVLSKLAGDGRTAAAAEQENAAQPVREAFFQKLGRIVHTLVGMLTALAGLFGAVLLGRTASPVRALVVAWLTASAVFLLLDQTLGDAIRWYYFAAGVLALLSGRYLAMLAGRGHKGRLLTWLCLAAMFVHVLSIWVGELILKRYHS